MNIINNTNFDAGQNGLPPVKAQSKDYEEREKIEIAKAAKEYGLKLVAEAYGLKWQSIAAWLKKKPGSKKMGTKIIIQSPIGQEITVKEIEEKVKALEAAGAIDSVYIRADENAIYWVRGEEHGSISLWS